MNGEASVEVLLRSMYLSTMARQCAPVAEKAEQENWGYLRYLKDLCELELPERAARRVQRQLREAELPEGKTYDTLELDQLPVKVRRQLPRLLEGTFVHSATNVLAFGLPGRGSQGGPYRAPLTPPVHRSRETGSLPPQNLFLAPQTREV